MATPDRAVAEGFLEGLNPQQRQAVTHDHGPLLILAGPGSGKTRVIVHRIAYLIAARDVRPSAVLAVTFTNKAARELRERLEALLGARLATGMSVGTFHSICSRWLRRDGDQIGLDRHFAIFDDNDQMDLVKQVLKEYELDEKRTSARAVLSAISHAKSEAVGPEAYARNAEGRYQETVARVYRRYAQLLEHHHGLDFDDLLLKTIELFREAPSVLERYQQRYEHVLVDEFQDTNIAQYQIVKLLTLRHRNLCVVGDEDQSIYGWRSADIRNILNFEVDFPDLRVVVLEQNYRSTGTILQVAQAVIAANRLRKDKRLWTDNGTGAPVVLHEAYSEQDEALFVVREIERLTRQQRVPLGGIAVMYRTNAQSRAIEDAFVRFGIPYRLVGGTRFYERREIKDLLAYLRLVQNPSDGLSLARVINTPPRGLGQKTVQEVTRWAASLGIPTFEALRRIAGRDEAGAEAFAAGAPAFAARTRELLASFVDLVEGVRAIAPERTVLEVLDALLERTGYERYVRDESEEGEERWQNVQELRAKAKEYAELAPENPLEAFLEDVSLVQDVDALAEDETPNAVTLITLHAAKGLEYPYVFLVGLEEGVLPHSRSVDDPGQLEEERRLLYVGITRAREALYLVYAFRRTVFGNSQTNAPSRFLADVPRAAVQTTHGGRADSAGRYGWLTARSSRPGASREEGRAVARRRFDFEAEEQPRSAFRPTAPAQSSATRPARPAAREGPTTTTYKPGDRVRHPTFGTGIVISARAEPSTEVIEVNFAGAVGLKKLDLAYAPLERA